jgi:hypothetical protein
MHRRSGVDQTPSLALLTRSVATTPSGGQSNVMDPPSCLTMLRWTSVLPKPPFGVIAPKYYDAQTPMAHLRHVSILHLIVAGGCTFETATGERRQVMAGDLLFLPFADHHKFWKGEPSEMAAAGEIVRPGPIEGVWTVNYGGGGDELRMVCGFLESSEFLFTPVFRTLPTLVVERTSEDNAP